MSTEEEFQEAAEKVKMHVDNFSQNELLELYGLYKQATVGDCNTDKPGFFDFKGKSKWEAWNNRKGTPQAEAMQEYIVKVKTLIEKFEAT